jgi:hypothetical protein
MRKLLLSAALATGLLLSFLDAPGQSAVEEITDIPCPIALNTHFNDYQPVPFEGKQFFSQWRSKSTRYPLPSYNWYYAYPERSPLSTDRTARWQDAELQVHCFRTRAMYAITYHYHPVAGAGKLVPVCEDDDIGAVDHQAYDPYEPASSGPEGGSGPTCDPGTGSGEGTEHDPEGEPEPETWVGAGSDESVCGGSDQLAYEEMCLEAWVEGQGWVIVWCGVGVVCLS